MKIQGEHHLLKCSGCEKAIKFLLETKWETKPRMGISFIIRNIDNFYYLTDFSNMDKHIGFMIYEREKETITYFEIIKEYRNLGYARDIIEHLELSKVYAEDDKVEFWSKFVSSENIIAEPDYF